MRLGSAFTVYRNCDNSQVMILAANTDTSHTNAVIILVPTAKHQHADITAGEGRAKAMNVICYLDCLAIAEYGVGALR